jgi:predicted TIM-barrel fold metal-dependent hydrolase
MLADLDRCHISRDTWRITPQSHLEASVGADYVVVFGLSAARTDWNIPNDYVHKHVSDNADRLIFFASIDPGVPGYMDELARCHQDLHCRGVKLGPVYQGVHPLDKRYREIYAYCQQNELPIMIHMGTTFSSGVPLEYARPVHMDQVACDYPDLRIVIAHLGHPWEHETIAAVRHQPNLYADISALYYRPWQFYNSMRLLVEYHTEDKVLFGTDYPATTVSSTIAALRSMNEIVAGTNLPTIPGEVLEGIIHRESLDLLGIPKPDARRNG